MNEYDQEPFMEGAQRFTQAQNQFAKMWTDFAGKMSTAGMSFSPETTPPDTARQMRETFFKALSGYCEDYMRSPEFLDSWKEAMDGAVEFRRQMNESLGRMQHELGGTSRQDVDSTMTALAHLERRLVDTIERSSEQIEDLAGRLEAMEEAVDALVRAGAGKGQKSSGKKKKKKGDSKKGSPGKEKRK